MKRKVQRFRLLLVGLAILIGGGIAWASTVGSGLAQQFGFSEGAEEAAASTDVTANHKFAAPVGAVIIPILLSGNI